MSSRFVNKAASDEIVLANGDKVTVRQRLTAEEDALLVRNMMRLKFDASKGEAQVEEGDWHLQRLNICEAYCLGWNFTDDGGNSVLCTPETIRQLDSDTINEIATAIDVFQKQRRESHEKNGLKPWSK